MIQIGSNSSSLREALSAHYDGHIISADSFYLTVDLPAEPLSNDLSAVLLERLLPRILLNAIAESEAHTAEEQEFLADAVSSELLRNGSAERFQSILSGAILDLLSESSRINIEGLLYFRLRSELSDFYLQTANLIENYRKHFEKNRLLQKLSNYIRERAPQIEFLKVIGDASGFQLLDADNKLIRCIFREDYTPEEHLLNSLLYLSPMTLDLSGFDHPELKNILEDIFSDRILEKD